MRWFKRLIAVAVLSMITVLAGVGASYGQDKVGRIGFQKYGKLVLLKSKGSLEPKLKALGYSVTWIEFPSGPPLLEAINVGAVDFGNTGESPPIFAQDAGAPIRYVAYEPQAPTGEAILIPKDSPMKSVADIRGETVSVIKCANVRCVLVKALEKAGVKYSDITPGFLAPADARAAFERGSVDAWAIWDPFQAAAEAATQAKTLADGTDTVANHQFYLSSQKFLESDPRILDAILAGLREVDEWAKTDIRAVAEQLSPSVGLPVSVLEVALKRQAYGIKPIDAQVIAEQQKMAEPLLALGLIPKANTVSDDATKHGS